MKGQNGNPHTYYGERLGASQPSPLVVDDIPLKMKETRFAKSQMHGEWKNAGGRGVGITRSHCLISICLTVSFLAIPQLLLKAGV